MLHKVSALCDKVDVIKHLADKLRSVKYGEAKPSKEMVDSLIQQIQYECLLVSQDKEKYKKK